MSLNNLSLIFDGVCFLIFIVNIFLGYKNGLVKTTIKMVSGIVAVFLAVNFAPVFAKVINLAIFLPTEYLIIAPFINRLIWYVVTFLIAIIALKVLAIVTELINKAPIIGKVNKALGAVLSFVYSFLIVSILSILISLPIFNLKEAYETSVLKPINTVAVTILNNVASSELELDTYTDSFKEKLYNWLIDNELINTDLMESDNLGIFNRNDKEIDE